MTADAGRGVRAADLVSLLLGALALRLALLVTTAGDPVFGTPMLDAEYAVSWAEAMRTHGPWMSPEGTAYFRTPLYAWFLSLAFLLPGPDLPAARVLQALLGAAAAALVADLTGRRLGRAAGIAAGALAAVSWPLLLFGRELLIEALVPFLGIAFLWTLDAARRRPSAARWLLAGAVLGVGAIARANFLIVAPVGLLLAAAEVPRARRALAFAAGLALLIAPVAARNRIVSGEWILLSYQGGLNLWIGNNPEADGMSARLPGLTSWRNEDVEALLARETGRAVGPAEQDAIWRGRAAEFFRESPGRALALMARKTYLLLQGYEIRNNRDLYLLRERDPLLSLPWPDFGWILPLAGVGMWVTRRRARELGDWYGYGLAAALGVIVFFVCARYRLIVWPALLPFAGAGAAALLDRRAGAALAGRAALLVALIVLARVDFLDVRSPDPSQPRFQYGNVYARVGDAEAAEREYRAALELAPGFAEARYHLGALLLEQGRLREALPELRAAAAAMPESFRVRRSLAEALELAGQGEEALAVRREALRLSAGHPDDRLALANGLGRVGRYEEAWATYGELLGEDRGADPFVLLNAGQTALALGLEEPGTELLTRAARDSATAGPALEALARYELSARRPKDAQRILSEAILLAPDNADLHRLRALARYADGDLSGAIQDLEEVVRMDPTDGESRRRLEDFRAGRGPR